MNIKKVLIYSFWAVLFPVTLLFFVGCAPKIPVDMKLKSGDLSFSEPYKLKIAAEYKLNNKPKLYRQVLVCY